MMDYIRLSTDMLDDRDWATLPDSTAAHALQIMLLSAESGTWRTIPSPMAFADRLHIPWGQMMDDMLILSKRHIIEDIGGVWTITYRYVKPGPFARDLSGWQRLRLEILEAFGYRCAYCGEPANHVDHVFPRSRGGTNARTNLVAACAPCNRHKWAKTPQEAGMELR